MIKNILFVLQLFVFVLVGAAGGPALAQNDVRSKADKTGTNPINFQNDVRLKNEYTWLNTSGDGDQNVTTLALRFPIVGDKWQLRFQARYENLSADFNNDGVDDINVSGLGDFDMRFLTVPYLDPKNGTAFAYAVEVFHGGSNETSSFNTALGPQVFGVKFFKPGFGFGPYKGGGLFGPGMQYKFDLDKDPGQADTDQILIDLNLLLMGNDKSYWFFTDPQIVIDNETNEEYCVCDFEFGWMMTRWFPDLKGHSFYIRPSIGIGADRPTDYAVEIAYKLVGWE